MNPILQPASPGDPGRLLEPAGFAAIAAAARENPTSSRLLLVHVASPAAYADAHIPGALLVQPGELVDGRPPAAGRLPDLAQLEHLFGRLGYTPDTHIVVHDDEGGGWAGRFIWTLDVIGHARWSLLDGGIQAWQAAGLPIERGIPPAPEPTRVALHIDRAPIAEIPDVLAAIDAPDTVIWDARSAAEYHGLRSGSRRAGHIPGAVNLDWLLLMDPARDMRLANGLAERLEQLGITPEKKVITHCQSHHRSGLSYLVARLLGFSDVRAYHGSWSEWGNRDDTPVETTP